MAGFNGSPPALWVLTAFLHDGLCELARGTHTLFWVCWVFLIKELIGNRARAQIYMLRSFRRRSILFAAFGAVTNYVQYTLYSNQYRFAGTVRSIIRQMPLGRDALDTREPIRRARAQSNLTVPSDTEVTGQCRMPRDQKAASSFLVKEV
jgi:hypothetical protein